MTDLDERANTPTDPVREALQKIVDATRVGKPGTVPLKSKWATYPSTLFHHALAALTAPQQTAAVGEVTQAAAEIYAVPWFRRDPNDPAGSLIETNVPERFADLVLGLIATRPAPAPNPSGDLVSLLLDIRDKGLIYWEPNTTRGRGARAGMIARIDADILALSDRQAGEGTTAPAQDEVERRHDDLIRRLDNPSRKTLRIDMETTMREAGQALRDLLSTPPPSTDTGEAS